MPAIKKVRKVVTKINKEVFPLKLRKWEFSKTNLTWLGFEMKDTGIRPRQSKIGTVMALQPPEFAETTQMFHGYAQSHVQIRTLSTKLHWATATDFKSKKKEKFSWSEKANNAFQNNLEFLTNKHKLYHYDASKQCRIKYEASHKVLKAT